MVETPLLVLMLIFPLIIAGILHMLVVKFNLTPFLARPIQVRWFGGNKTWRGVFFMPLFGILGVLLSKHFLPASSRSDIIFERPVLLGACLGLAYVLCELPNSFLKRRMGIAPGQQATQNRALFFLLDHTDSILGCVLVYALLTPAEPVHLLQALLMAPIIHTLINLLLWSLGIRKQKF